MRHRFALNPAVLLVRRRPPAVHTSAVISARLEDEERVGYEVKALRMESSTASRTNVVTA